MKFKRRQYIVNKSFQWKFGLSFAVAALIGNGISTAVLIYFAKSKLDELQWRIHVTAKTTGEIMQSLFLKFSLINFVFILVLLIILSVWMMKRMNGPLYRISKDLNRVGEGDFSTSIAVRGKDEFKYVAEALNQMVGKMRERLFEFRDRYDDLSRDLIDLEVRYARRTDAEERAKELIQAVRKLRLEGPLEG